MADGYSHDDIAIIGLGCRFPGDAVSPSAFFDMLLKGRDAWKVTPSERFNVDSFYHPSAGRQGSTVVRGGYYLKEDVALFDAPFFSMTKGEADAMDPQQRLLLEVAFESMENDYDLLSTHDLNDTLQYSATGNGLGMLSNRLSWFYDFRGPSMTVDTACSGSLVALHLACEAIRRPGCQNRTAFVGGVGLILSPDAMISANSLGFFSPDSKCFSFDERANGYARGEGASVLVIKHIEDAIRDGDTIRAVIRGSGVNSDGKTPGITLPSPEAQATLIRSTYKNAGLELTETAYFEAHGTGTPAGDPVEMEAISNTFGLINRDPDRPLYVGTVKPNIGHLEGCAGLAGVLKTVLTLESGMIPPNLNFEIPNPKLRLEEWGLKIPTQCTPWPQDGLRRASVNSFGYGGTNAHVILDDAWHYLELRGICGSTNTAIVGSSLSSSTASLDMAPSPTTSISSGSVKDHDFTKSCSQQRVFVFSAPEQGAVERLMQKYSKFLKGAEASQDGSTHELLENIAYTLGNRRSIFPWRSAVIASSTENLISGLESNDSLPSRAAEPPNMVWVFTGQGAQWFAMGRELFAHNAFKDAILDADEYLTSIGCDFSVYQELMSSKEESRVDSAKFSQPLCTALQIALVDLMHHWGIRPAAVVGHSSGEIGAAYALGALSAHDCLKVAFERGRFSQGIRSIAPNLKGSMTSVGLSEEAIKPYLQNLEADEVAVVACVNSPSNITLSGDTAALDKIEAMLKKADVFVRRLKVDNAYHSPHMKYAAESYSASIQGIKVLEPKDNIVMHSSVTGLRVSVVDLGPSYWVANMTSPVQFVKAMDSIFTTKSQSDPAFRAQAINTIIEIGPHSALQGPLKQILKFHGKFESTKYLSMLVRGQDAIRTSLQTAAKLWTQGSKLNLRHLNSLGAEAVVPKSLPSLPSYPWNHTSRYWFSSAQENSHLFATAPRLDWLGAPVEDFNPLAPSWKNRLRVSELPWLAHHSISGNIIFPGAGMMCCALEAARQMADPMRIVQTYEFRDITMGRALLVPDSDRGVEIFTSLTPRKTGMKARDAPWYEYTLFSLQEDGGHNEHSSGLVKIEYKPEEVSTQGDTETNAEVEDYKRQYQKALQECTASMEPTDMYAELISRGMQFTGTFQAISDIKMANGKAIVDITIPNTKDIMPGKFEYEHLLHPATLDACLHGLLAATAYANTDEKHVAIVVEIERASVSAQLPRGAGKHLTGVIQASRTGYREMQSSVVVSNAVWDIPLIVMTGIRSTELGGMVGKISPTENTAEIRKICSEIIYKVDLDLIRQKEAQRIFQQSIEDTIELEDFVTSAQRAAVIYIDRALKTLADDDGTFQPHLVQYVKWLREKHTLATKGLLRGQDSTDAWLHKDAADDEEFLRSFEATCVDAKLLTSVGDGILAKSYAEAHGVVTGVHMIKNWFDAKGHKQPNMKVLEVGAGTGSITLPILQTLKPHLGTTPRFGSYVFTDISPGFFESAGELLKDWEGYVEFKKLDIEKCPLQQGFELGSFDVVAASNVLHATKNIAKTLKNCYNLLKPGGKLVLGEITNPAEYMSLIYGTLPGWWLSEDGRVGGPCLTTDQWSSQLADAQFDGLDFVVDDTTQSRNHIISMMVATKPKPPSTPFKEILIVKGMDASSHVDALASVLAKELAYLGSTTEVKDLADSISLNSDGVPNCNGKFVLSLLEVEAPLLSDLPEREFYYLRLLITQSTGILWITCDTPSYRPRNPHLRAVSGFFRVIKSENTQLRLHELHLSRPDGSNLEQLSNKITYVFKSIPVENLVDLETEIVEEDDTFKIPRLMDERFKNWDIHTSGSVPQPELQPLLQPGRPLALTVGIPGILDSLHFIDDLSLSSLLADNEVEIEVKANSLNFKDVMVAMGHVTDRAIGSDAAGIVRRVGAGVSRLSVGDRVAVLQRGAMRTHLRVDSSIPQKLPEGMSLEDGATIPTVFVTAYHALIETAHLERGETVLIHRASGGLGQAMIQIAQKIGATIFATAGSHAKRQLLTEQYGIPVQNIFTTRDLTFAKGIMRVTKGKGVDVIVNSLEGEALRKTWECIADFGRFLELGMRDILANSGLDMAPFAKSITFASINIDHICRTSVPKIARLLEKVFDLIRDGTFKVVTPVTLYDYSEFEQVFRLMNDGKNVGKIVFKITPESIVNATPQKRSSFTLNPNGTYVLVGGLGGLGRGMALYLAGHGAKNIAFISRSGAIKPESREVLEELHSKNVNAIAYSCDVADTDKLKLTIDQICQDMPVIKGVIQAAMVLKDSIFENMEYESWVAATRPKIQGTWNLHELMPKDLDFFIMLSSATAIIGNRGQANYCAGNTFQDALAYHRKALGLPAVSIDLGAIRGIGWVAENKDSEILKAMDRIIVDQEHFYSVLNSAITGYSYGEHKIPTQLVTAAGTGAESLAIQQSGSSYDLWWLDEVKFAYLRQVDLHGKTKATEVSQRDLKALLVSAKSITEASEVVQSAIVQKLAKLVVIPEGDIDVSKPVHHYGVDSLVAIDFRNWIFRELKSTVTVFDILNSVPMTQLSVKIAKNSELVSEEHKKE